MAATQSGHTISAPASLVFETLLNGNTWSQWSHSIVGTDVTPQSAVESSGKEPKVRDSWKRFSDFRKSMKIDLPSALAHDTRLTIWSTEDPRQPWTITTSKITILEISRPETRSNESTARRQKDSVVTEGPDGGRQHRLSQSVSLSTSSSYVLSYVLTESTATKKSNSCCIDMSVLSKLRRTRRQQAPSKVYTHIISPLTEDSCSLHTTVEMELKAGSDVSKAQEEVQQGKTNELSYHQSFARELGGYCVRLFSQQTILDSLALRQQSWEMDELDDASATLPQDRDRIQSWASASSRAFEYETPDDFLRKHNRQSQRHSVLVPGLDDEITLGLEAQMGDETI